MAHINNQENLARLTVEKLFSEITPHSAQDKETIKRGALARFKKELEAKLANLQEGEYLQISFRVDILTEDGKVRGGIYSQRTMPQYTTWRTAVFQRDNYECKVCGSKTNIVAHHVKHWAKHPESRFDIDNGVTLCGVCHTKEHPHLKIAANGTRKRP